MHVIKAIHSYPFYEMFTWRNSFSRKKKNQLYISLVINIQIFCIPSELETILNDRFSEKYVVKFFNKNIKGNNTRIIYRNFLLTSLFTYNSRIVVITTSILL